MTQQDTHLFYQTPGSLPLLERSQGIYRWDHTGKKYIDACSSAVIANIGYGRERIEKRIADQAQKGFFAYRTQFSSQASIDLAGKLAKASAPHLNKVFFVSGGSEAMESAMKLCRQFFYNTGQGSRHLFISRRYGFHGSTLGALSLTSSGLLEPPFKAIVKTHPRIPYPFCFHCDYNLTYPACNLKCAHALEQCILENGEKNIAAFVAESIGGSSTGAVVPPDDYFDVIQNICKKYGIMLILDEVMTGFGRTGKMFGYEHWPIKADIVALSKGLSSGYYPFGAAVTTNEIVDTLMDAGGFMHGHTYAGNPMACAIGEEVFDIIMEENLVNNSAVVGTYLKNELKQLQKQHDIIGDIRGKGLFIGVEITKPSNSNRCFDADLNVGMILYKAAFDLGLILYPRRCLNGVKGDHFLVSPPLTTTKNEIDLILERLDEAFINTKKNLM